MSISRVKFGSKVVQSENVEHVRISYDDAESSHSDHWQGADARAKASFYDAFNNLNFYMTKILCVAEDLATGFSVRDVAIKESEYADGNDNTSYVLISGFKSGHAATEIKVTLQAKYQPEGMAEAIATLVKEAEKYIAGEREPVEVKQEELELGQSADDQPETEEETEEENEPEEDAA